MELGSARRHYNVPVTRTIHIGEPPSEIEKLADVIIEGGNLALETAKPGATCEEVEAIFQKTIKRHGYQKIVEWGIPLG